MSLSIADRVVCTNAKDGVAAMNRCLTLLLLLCFLNATGHAQTHGDLVQLVVISNAGQSDVFIDGKRTGVTPYAGRYAPGLYRVRVSRKGYAAWEQQIQLNEDQRLMVTLTAAQRTGTPTWVWGVLSGVILAGGATGAYFLIKKSSGTTPLPGTPPSPP